MSNAEDISSTILSNVDVIATIYSIIKDAGLQTTANDSVKAVANSTTIIKANIPDVNRATKNCRAPKVNDRECRTSTRYSITYDAADIMIVGGAALNLYDYLLTGFKGRHKMTALEDYIKKKTSDIDIVWWPRSVIDTSTGRLIKDEIVTSSSPAITKLVQVLRDQIAAGLEVKKAEIQERLKTLVPGAKNTDELTIEVGGDKYELGKPAHFWKAGSWTVAINFKYAEKVFKICEVIIHDSGASQLYDENGNVITDLRYMEQDPVYCSPNPSRSNSISWLSVDGTDIAVPNILSFVKQQMLAFGNNVTKNPDESGKWNFKGFINYKRVEFIKLLLKNINISDSSNKADLLEVFKTSNTEYPAYIVTQINQIENNNIERLKAKILQLCDHYNTSEDPIILELCKKAAGEDLESWITNKAARLTELTSILHNQYKTAPRSEFRRAYSDLERKADNYRLTIQKLTTNELKNHPLYKEDPVLLIEREKAEINRDLEEFKKTNKPKPQNVRVENKAPARKAPAPMRAPARGDRGILGESPFPPASMRRPESMAAAASYSASPPPPPPLPTYPPPRTYMPAYPAASYGPSPSYGPQPSYGHPPPRSGYAQPVPVIHVMTDPRTGNPWYIDPYTGNVVMRNPHTGVWEMKGPYMGPPLQRGKGEYNRTYKNRQRYNNTRKNKE